VREKGEGLRQWRDLKGNLGEAVETMVWKGEWSKKVVLE
jgi:hypothetical protein